MLKLKEHMVSVMTLLLLLLATGVLAAERELVDGINDVEEVDCVHYTDKPDSRCSYVRIFAGKKAQLFVVAEGDSFAIENAKHGAEFMIYAPKAGTDSLKMYLESDKSNVKTKSVVKSSEENGLLSVIVSSKHAIENVPLGTISTVDAGDRDSLAYRIFLMYTFYVPGLEYSVDGKVVGEDFKLRPQVGDTVRVDVRAYVTVGPDSGKTDPLDDKRNVFYFSTTGQAKDIKFLPLPGDTLRQKDQSIGIALKEGLGGFLMVSNTSVTEGSFALEGFDEGRDASGKPSYVLTEEFPGDLQFVNPSLPALDSASIYDTDGDGIGDSIATWYGGDMTDVSVKDFNYSWPTEDDYKNFGDDDIKLNDNTYGYPGVNVPLQGESAKGSVKAEICSSVSGLCEETKTVLNDRIGTVIQSAKLMKGNGEKDTLVVRFTKSVDSSWTEGQGLKFIDKDGVEVKAIKKNGSDWTFVVDAGKVTVGDMVKIDAECSSEKCPDGILTAADGIPTAKNNQEVMVTNFGRVYVDNENNGFYDRNGDGRMDSASVGFELPITEAELKNVRITFFWLDSAGKTLSITPSMEELVLSSDGKYVGYALDPEKFGVKKMLTAIDQSYAASKDDTYGYAVVASRVTDIDGKETYEEVECSMGDRMPPVISGTFLFPESFQEMEPDKFTISFSEAMDNADFELTDDCLMFYVDGAWVSYSLSNAEWSSDGKSVTVYMEDGVDLSSRMNPADSVRFGNFENGLKDRQGNRVVEVSPAVMVQGDPRVVMKTTSLAGLNRAEELSDRVTPFTIDHGDPSKKENESPSLGVVMDVGFSTIMKPDSSGNAQPDMKNIGLTWELFVYTNLGAYVGGASGKIACDDEFFDGNCLENPDKLYVRWNMRADDGRRVGVGVYLAKFKIKVYGAQEDFKIERVFRWGITSSRK